MYAFPFSPHPLSVQNEHSRITVAQPYTWNIVHKKSHDKISSRFLLFNLHSILFKITIAGLRNSNINITVETPTSYLPQEDLLVMPLQLCIFIHGTGHIITVFSYHSLFPPTELQQPKYMLLLLYSRNVECIVSLYYLLMLGNAISKGMLIYSVEMGTEMGER